MDGTKLLVEQQETSQDRLLVVATFADITPIDLFAYWVRPDLLTQWWPQTATIEPVPGGHYCLSWPAAGWTLDGHIQELVHGAVLAFTWKWMHRPDLPQRQVRVQFMPAANGGTQLTIEHGNYNDSAIDQEDRNSHLVGWQHFLGQLAAYAVRKPMSSATSAHPAEDDHDSTPSTA